jgi:hypothetical protein
VAGRQVPGQLQSKLVVPVTWWAGPAAGEAPMSQGFVLSEGNVLSEGCVVSEGFVLSEGYVLSEEYVLSQGFVLSEGYMLSEGLSAQRRYLLSEAFGLSDVADPASEATRVRLESLSDLVVVPVETSRCGPSSSCPSTGAIVDASRGLVGVGRVEVTVLRRLA